MEATGTRAKKARITYTVENRRGDAVRKAKEVAPDKVEKEIDRLTDRGGFNFDVTYEA